MTAELRYMITRNICIQKTANGWFFLTTAWFVTLPCYPVLVAAIFRNFPIEFLPDGAFIYHTESIGFRLWFMAKYRKDTSSGIFISVGQSWLRKSLYKNIGQRALLLAGAVGQKRSFRSWQCIMGNHAIAHFKIADVLHWFFFFLWHPCTLS